VILLDTNVLSALMRDRPDPQVVAWLDGQPQESICTTSVTLFEIRMGLELLPDGRRRPALAAAFQQLIDEDLRGRILAFDPSAGLAVSAAAGLINKPAGLRGMGY
jgi:toxin FitB